ncbi:MAG: glycoside hydrolase family 3 protein, partial [Actinomycetota bacterium]|nr:glycoside hydrolase family 3 protein [Actinomycetota bacterium]
MAGSTTTLSGVPPPANPSCPARVLATMDGTARVGQLFFVGVPMSTFNQQAIQAMVDSHAGGVVLYGNSQAGVAGIRRLTDQLRAKAGAKTPGVGLYIAADQEGGEIQELAGPGFDAIPPADQQGKIDPGVLQRQARRWA